MGTGKEHTEKQENTSGSAGEKSADVASEEASKGAATHLDKQRQDLAHQKDTENRPPNPTTKGFGRPEILGDDGKALVKGAVAAAKAIVNDIANDSRVASCEDKSADPASSIGALTDGKANAAPDVSLTEGQDSIKQLAAVDVDFRSILDDVLKAGNSALAHMPERAAAHTDSSTRDKLTDAQKQASDSIDKLPKSDRLERGGTIYDLAERTLRERDKITHELNGKEPTGSGIRMECNRIMKLNGYEDASSRIERGLAKQRAHGEQPHITDRMLPPSWNDVRAGEMKLYSDQEIAAMKVKYAGTGKADKSGEPPADGSGVKPVDKPVDKSGDKPSDKPVDSPEGKKGPSGPAEVVNEKYSEELKYDDKGNLTGITRTERSGERHSYEKRADGWYQDGEKLIAVKDIKVDKDGTITTSCIDGSKLVETRNGDGTHVRTDNSAHTRKADGSEISTDSQGRVTQVKRADGSEMSYGYDATTGKMNYWKGASGEWTSDDGGKNWKSKSTGESVYAETSVDAEGNEHRKLGDNTSQDVNRDGSTVDKDEKGRVTHVTRSDGSQVDYGYNTSTGQLNYWKGASGEWTSGDDGKTWVSKPSGAASGVETSVDANGTEHRKYPDGHTEDLNRDGSIHRKYADHMEDVRTDGTKVSTSSDGSTHTTNPNGSEVDKDSAGHVTRVKHTDAFNSEVKYGYDQQGRLSSRDDMYGHTTSNDGGKTWTNSTNTTYTDEKFVDKFGNEHRFYPDGADVITHPDGSETSRVALPNGDFRESHTGKSGDRKDENYQRIATADGRVEIKESDGTLNHFITGDPNVDASRNRLNELAKHRITNPQELAKFEADMARFEERSRKMEEVYRAQGKSPEEASKEAHKQVADTYKEVTRLLEARDNPNVPLDATRRAQIAEQILAQAASPSSIDQNPRGTCNVSDVENRTYTRCPAEAARLVVDVATTGQYETSASIASHKHPPTIVHVDPASLKPDEQSQRHPPADGYRGLASQVFQVTGLNIHYAVKYPDATDPAGNPSRIRYEQREEYKRDGMRAYADQVMDYSDPAHPKKVTDGAGEACGAIKEMGDQINPKDAADDWYITAVKDESDLTNRLKDAKEHGKLPITLLIMDGAHVVNVSDYDPATGRVKVDNTWGSWADKQVTVHDLMKMDTVIYSPTYPEFIDKLKASTQENRRKGVEDYEAGREELILLQVERVPVE